MANDKYSNEKINLPDGEYIGFWSAYTLEILPPPIVLKIKEGIRGVNCKTKVIIKDNKIIDLI